jgi:DNA polymerase I-like protein with 3'-5' exonuclease and polymerase domains
MKTATQQIDKLLVYADGDRLYPNYNLLGAATGRFRVAQPELQNLVANENCNVRELLLEDKNVFMIDFSSQEPRMSA